MLPLFPPSLCRCQQSWDPLGLHAASCIHLNAYNLLHNAVRDCFAGAARKCVSKDPGSQVSYILTDKFAKSATWMHHFFPLKPDAPAVLLKDDPQRRPAPSLSPDILIAFNNDPLHPYFGDFVASSPSATNRLRHGEAAQLKFTEKLRHYSKHHDFPSRICYPLAFERSGYLHLLPLTTLSTFSRGVHLLNTSHALHFNSNLPLHLLLHLLQLHCCVRRATAFYRAPYCPLLPPCPSQFHRAGRLFSPLTLLGVYTDAFLHLLLALLRSVHWMVSPTLRCLCHWRAPTPENFLSEAQVYLRA